jgi:hypothetical protein
MTDQGLDRAAITRGDDVSQPLWKTKALPMNCATRGENRPDWVRLGHEVCDEYARDQAVWGLVDEETLACYLVDACDPIEIARVEQELARKPMLRELVDSIKTDDREGPKRRRLPGAQSLLYRCAAAMLVASFLIARAFLERNNWHEVVLLCSYSNSASSQPLFYSDLQPGSAEAQQAINEMLRACGVQNAIQAFIGPVDNAEARIVGNRPVIVYNPSFFQRLAQQTSTRWSVISVLAHEIGHHANFDTFGRMQSNPHSAELRADYFSGSMMARMGASLQDALVAQQVYGTEDDTQSHPAKDSRVAEITRGYRSVARNQGPEPRFDPAPVRATPRRQGGFSRVGAPLVNVDAFFPETRGP